MTIEQPSSCIAIPFSWQTGWSAALTVIDQAGTRTVTINPGATVRTARVFLAYTGGIVGSPGTNSGTEADPDEILMQLQVALNAAVGSTIWFVTMTQQGLVLISYSGTGTGTITFPADTTLNNVLGITSTTIGPLGGGTGFTAQFPPSYFATVPSRSASTDWTDVPPMIAAAQMETGDVYGNQSGIHGMRIQFDCNGLPRDATQRTALGSVLPPLFPPPGVRWTAPTSSTAGTSVTASTASLPWTFYETIKTTFFTRFGIALANFQALAGVAPTDTRFFDVFLEPATMTRVGAIRPLVTGSLSRSNWSQLGLRYKQQMSR